MGNEGDMFKPTTEDSNYDVNKDTEYVVGAVNAAEAPSDGSNGQQASPQQSFTPAPINPEDVAAQGRGEWNEGQSSKTNGNEVRGEINPYRIQSDTPYKILGVTKTKNGTIVHVDEYPTQKISPEEKEIRAKKIGELAGYGLGAAGAIATAEGGPVAMGLGMYGGYDAGKTVGTAAGISFYRMDPSVPITQKGDVRYIRVM